MDALLPGSTGGMALRINIVYQDNESAIKLVSNGHGSSGTRHINVRFFFIADRIKDKEVGVACCPTSDMVADFLPNHRRVRFSEG